MKSKNLVFVLSIFTLLAGCSTLSKTECLSTDWQQVGFEDGEKGIDALTATSYKDSCANHNVAIDMDDYNLGHLRGTALFCQTDNGFKLGEQGYQYSVICPQAFENEYTIGYQFYIAYSNISYLENTLYTNETTIEKLKLGVNNAIARLNSETLSVFEENELRQRIDSMTGQIQGYELSTQRLEPTLHQSQQQLERLRSHYDR